MCIFPPPSQPPSQWRICKCTYASVSPFNNNRGHQAAAPCTMTHLSFEEDDKYFILQKTNESELSYSKKQMWRIYVLKDKMRHNRLFQGQHSIKSFFTRQIRYVTFVFWREWKACHSWRTKMWIYIHACCSPSAYPIYINAYTYECDTFVLWRGWPTCRSSKDKCAYTCITYDVDVCMYVVCM